MEILDIKIHFFLMMLIVPSVVTLSGWYMWKVSYKKISRVQGYRTRLSMKNQEMWEFANKDCGMRFFKLGWIMLLSIVIIGLFSRNFTSEQLVFFNFAASIVEIVLMLFCALITEYKLIKMNNSQNSMH